MQTANTRSGRNTPPFVVPIRGGIYLTILVASLFVAACQQPSGDYLAASSISADGFARNGQQVGALNGQEVKLWGYVDQGNIYGDEGARAILGDWWSGPGPDASTWRFNLKAHAGDATGQSFAVTVPNDGGRDDLLRQFAADAQARRPTRVLLTGTLSTFDAPANNKSLTGLTMALQSSGDIIVE